MNNYPHAVAVMAILYVSIANGCFSTALGFQVAAFPPLQAQIMEASASSSQVFVQAPPVGDNPVVQIQAWAFTHICIYTCAHVHIWRLCHRFDLFPTIFGGFVTALICFRLTQP